MGKQRRKFETGFKQQIVGEVDSVLSVYNPEAVFLHQSRELKKGR